MANKMYDQEACFQRFDSVEALLARLDDRLWTLNGMVWRMRGESCAIGAVAGMAAAGLIAFLWH